MDDAELENVSMTAVAEALRLSVLAALDDDLAASIRAVDGLKPAETVMVTTLLARRYVEYLREIGGSDEYVRAGVTQLADTIAGEDLAADLRNLDDGEPPA